MIVSDEFWEHVDRLVSESAPVIDTPRGTAHPEYADMIYPLDYGYLAGTIAPDGGGIDVWIGSLDKPNPVAIICTVDLVQRVAGISVMAGCTDAELQAVIDFLNSNDQMSGILIRRP